jgi:hypothetical protein
MREVKHLEERFDSQFVGFRAQHVASIPAIPAKNHDAAGWFIAKCSAYQGVKNTHWFSPDSAGLNRQVVVNERVIR